MISWRISLKITISRKISNSKMCLKKFKFEIDLLWVYPSSKIWTVVKSTRLSHEDSVEVDLKKIQVFVEQAVLLLGQAPNSIFCYRRFFILQALTDSQQQNKQMLTEDSELLQVNDKNLFENKFRTYAIPPNQKSKPQKCYRIYHKQITNPFATVFSRHRERVLEGSNNKSIFSD